MRIVGRISAKGTEYFKTALRREGEEQDAWIPVYLKKGVEKLNYQSVEKKVDSLGKVYNLYIVEDRNVFLPVDENTNKIEKAIVLR